ncbi:MAG: transcription elongation factor GreA [Bacteroidia bacterium]|nr:transcription elongation factor GreA [Bacteroidia bacterium]
MSEQSFYTREGLQKLKDELHDLKTRGRGEIARQIQEAREKGDLSENAEYDAAKEAQGMLELKIQKLETAIVNARVLDESEFDSSKIFLMSRVKLRNLANKQEVTYTLVSPNESDLKAGKISIDSPIGKGLVGRAKNDEVEIAVPAGTLKFKILDISR